MAQIKKNALNDRQEKFVSEYLIDLNGTQAAIRAGYSKKTAREIGSTLLTNINIQGRIKARMHEREKRHTLNQDFVIKELVHLASAKMEDYIELDENGKPRFKDFNVIDTRAIQEIKMTKDGTVSFKLYPKSHALELLGKHLALFTERLNIQGEVTASMSDADRLLISQFIKINGGLLPLPASSGEVLEGKEEVVTVEPLEDENREDMGINEGVQGDEVNE